MQDAVFYCAAHETLGTVRDWANARNCPAPTLVRGVGARLRLRLFASREDPVPYPLEKLEAVASWQWAMDADFNEATCPILVGDHEHITAGTVAETVEGIENEYTEIIIPMPSMNTEELVSWLGTEKSKSALHGELVGFDETGRQIFVLQIENFTVRNRITSAGNPTDIPPQYMTVPQIEALFTSRMEVQVSEDGTAWETLDAPAAEAPQNFRFYRFRNAAVGEQWSDPLPLLRGPRGRAGTLAVGSVSGGQTAAVSNSGTEHDAVFDFVLPKGDKGDTATVTIGTVTTTAAGTIATVTNSGTAHDAVLDFTIPKGDTGSRGNTGTAATFTLGTVTTGEPGTAAAITNTGTNHAAILNFTLPRGETGLPGARAAIAAGTTATGEPGTAATVTNSGTPHDAVLNFRIPQGLPGTSSHLRTAWAWDATGAGFSLDPSDDRPYRAEIILDSPRIPTAADFAASRWQRVIGQDGAVANAIAVTDAATLVPGVTRLRFANALVTPGDAGEAVVTFSGAGVPEDGAFNGLALIRGTVSTPRAGGGSSGGNAGDITEGASDYDEPSQTPPASVWP